WETSIYTDRERAALRWAEAVTRLEHQRVSDDVYEHVRRHFSEQELIALTLLVVEINGWNRFAIAFQYHAGDYRPGSLQRRRSALSPCESCDVYASRASRATARLTRACDARIAMFTL